MMAAILLPPALFIASFLILLTSTNGFSPLQIGTCKYSRPSLLHRLSMTSDVDAETTKQLYNIKNSSWSSSQWNWGSARGTGHDCAAICRRRWSDKTDRKKLVEALLEPEAYHAHHRGEVSFEEVKLILGLTWQRAGRSHPYTEVLETMADAQRYEIHNDEVLSALNFIEDMRDLFPAVARNRKELDLMNTVAGEVLHYHKHIAAKDNIFRIRRICAGMVLDAMRFVENGI